MVRVFLGGKRSEKAKKRKREEAREMKTFCACRSVIETNTIIIDDDDGRICFLLFLRCRESFAISAKILPTRMFLFSCQNDRSSFVHILIIVIISIIFR